MTGWKSLLVVGALVSWLGKLLLFDISDAADWFWYFFVGCWLILFCLVWLALFRRNWRELGVFAATLTVTIFPVLGVGDGLVERVQDGLLRVYILHRIGAPPFDEFLSKCKLVSYVEDDGGKHTIGQCNDGLRSTQWFLFSVITTRPDNLPCRVIADRQRGG